MTRSKFTVTLLLVNLGLVLLAGYLWRKAHPPAEPAAPSGPGVVATSSGGPSQPVVRVVKTNVVETNTFRWSQVEADDYRTYIERLRGIGVPEQTIRDLIVADIDKLFAPRLNALRTGGEKELQYWQSDDKELESADEYRHRERQRRAVDYEKREIIRQLLGIDLVSERQRVQGAEDFFGRRLGFLSEDKRGQVRTIIERFNEEELAIRRKVWEEGESLTEEEQLRLQQLQQQREVAVTNLFTPAELEQYQITMSPLAYKLRDSLFGMNPSENEYLALFRLRKAFEEKWGDGSAAPAEPLKRAEWEQDVATITSQIKESLGDQRYAEYTRAQDPAYRELALAAARYKAPAAAAAEVYEYRRVVLEQRATVAGNRSLTREQQQAALSAMAAETERAVRATLGDRAYSYYLRSGQGGWIHGDNGQ
ncbi:MAG: hypothetical protein HZA90_10855 [Verrucomicrobia bacterium]|nr:hypothetical protein [Verrucomicrobiota bacterium]